MGSSGQIGARQDEWDQVWQDYDRRRPAALQPVAVPQPATPAATPSASMSATRRRSRGHGLLLAVAACLGLMALGGLPETRRYPAPAEALASMASLAPEEAEMPPLTVAVSRLAAESTAAACWVMRLAPRVTPHQGPPRVPPCVEP